MFKRLPGFAVFIVFSLSYSVSLAGLKPVEPQAAEPAESQAQKQAPAPERAPAAKRAVQASGKSKTHIPIVKIGDTAVYQLTDLKIGKKSSYTHLVTNVTDDKIVVRTGSSTSNTYTRDWNWIETKRNANVDAAAMPAQPEYKFPLKVGESWDARWTSRTRGGDRKLEHQRRVTVEALEKVAVAAGTFEAFRLRAEGHYSAREGAKIWSSQVTKTYWYAPSISRVIKSELEDKGSRGFHKRESRELISFTPGG